MQNTWLPRLLFTLALTTLAVFLLTPTVRYFTLDDAQRAEVQQDRDAFRKYLPSWMPESHIVPGLDLQGGVHMVLGVDVEKAISDKARRIATRMRNDLTDKKIGFTAIDHLAEQGKGDRVKVVFATDADKKKFQQEDRDNFGDLAEVSDSGLEMVFRVHPDWVSRIKKDAVDQTIKTITNRIDKMHVTEPSISKRGDDQVQVQLPGYSNPEEAKSLIGRTAQLEFQMVDDTSDFLSKLTDVPEGLTLRQSPYQRRDGGMALDMYFEFPESKLKDARAFLVGKAPSGLEIKFGHLNTKLGEEKKMRTYTLEQEVAITGDDLVDARVSPGTPENPSPAVGIEFSAVGKKVFGELTTKNVGRRMAIVLEDIVDSAPVINEPITTGNASISMGSGQTMQEKLQEANQLALVLKSGALPAPVSFREERSVGPSLGRDALRAAEMASIVGLAAVFCFMVFIYRLGGLFAMVATSLNVLFVLAVLSWLNGTITLPGIAGLLLTVGMSVDANVLINERMRDELLAGKNVRAAVQAGYASAFRAILDAHVTTFIAGLVLWRFGSGPIQNFATTMLIGVPVTLFTAVFVTRIFFDIYTLKPRETLSI